MTSNVNNIAGRGSPVETFVCEHCNRPVSAVAPGARERSHCPHCLWSLHGQTGEGQPGVDCRGPMEPVGIATPAGGAWSLVHRCRQCAATEVHSIAVDDNGAALLRIAARLTGKAGSQHRLHSSSSKTWHH